MICLQQVSAAQLIGVCVAKKLSWKSVLLPSSLCFLTWFLKSVLALKSKRSWTTDMSPLFETGWRALQLAYKKGKSGRFICRPITSTHKTIQHIQFDHLSNINNKAPGFNIKISIVPYVPLWGCWGHSQPLAWSWHTLHDHCLQPGTELSHHSVTEHY